MELLLPKRRRNALPFYTPAVQKVIDIYSGNNKTRINTFLWQNLQFLQLKQIYTPFSMASSPI
jgi:hypothetical protein